MDTDVIILRPQPLGLHPLPAGLLLLPMVDAPDARARVLRGAVDGEVPECWRFWQAACQGRLGDALPHVGDDALGRYNAFVLAPSLQGLAALRGELIEPLRSLVDVAAYALGLSDSPPEPSHALDGELRGHACAARAAWHLEHGALDDAVAALEEGARAARAHSPVGAAQLHVQLAALTRETPGCATTHLREAIALAHDALLPDLRAELHLELGMLLQEEAAGSRALLGEAVKAYHEAIHAGFDAERRPDMYGLVQNNIGLAYLATPMLEASDQLRVAVAVQSFREATRMFTRERQPQMWAATRLNLANALQYAPSSHPAENLARAVELYDELLEARGPRHDPIGHARVLANQANALAHLGGLTLALDKLAEALAIAVEHGDTALAGDIRDQIASVDGHRQQVRDRDAATAFTP